MKNCYNCFWGGDGEEIADCGHCWLHNGEPDFVQPDKEKGCDEWVSQWITPIKDTLEKMQ